MEAVRRRPRLAAGVGVAGLAVVLIVGAQLVTPRPGASPSTAAFGTASPVPTIPATPGTTPGEPTPTQVAVGTPVALLPACAGPRTPGEAGPTPAPVKGDVTFETIERLGGPVTSVDVADGFAYVGSGATVVVVELRGPAAAIVGAVSLPAAVRDLDVEGGRVAVAAGEAGLALLDVADPARPILSAVIPLPGYAEGVDLVGGIVFVADGPGGLRIVDLEAVGGPAPVGAVLDEHLVLDVVVAGSVAYLAAADEGLYVIDVAAPQRPVMRGAATTGGYAYGIDVDGPTAYIADGWAGLALIDVGDPSKPIHRTSIATGSWALGVDASDGLVHVGSGAAGLVVVDPRIAAPIGRIAHPDSRAVDVSVADDRAYLADARSGLLEVELADPGSPAMGRSVGLLAEVFDVSPAPGGEGLLVAAGTGGLWELAATADGLRPVSSIAAPLGLQDVVAVGAHVIATGAGARDGPEHGLLSTVLDSADPGATASFVLGAADFSGWHPGSRPAVQGGLAYFALEVGLLIVDVTATPPCLVGNLRTQTHGELEIGYVGGVTVVGEVAYLGANEDGIYVVDVAQPGAARLVRALPVAAGVGGAITAGGSALYAVDGGVLVVYDLSDPRNPRRRGELELPFESRLLTLSAGHLFVAAGTSILAIDIADPRRPRLAGRHELPGSISRLTAREDVLYASLGTDGLAVVRWKPGNARPIRVPVPLADAFDSPVPIAPLDGDRTAALANVQFPDRPAIVTTSTCVVATADAAGPSSLRGCLDGARPGTRVTFDAAAFPRARPTLIEPEDTLEVPDGVTVDGRGAGVVLDGRRQVDLGLMVGSGAAVLGLQVRNFSDTGISVGGDGSLIAANVVTRNEFAGIGVGGSGNWVVGNFVGLGSTGRRSAGFQFTGVLVEGFGNVIGGPSPEDANVIAGNQFNVDLTGDANIVAGNLIGTDRIGRRVVGPAVEATDGAAIGIRSGGHLVAGNLIGGSIEVLDFAAFNSIVGNRIGLDPDGRPLACQCVIGVYTPWTRIGGSRPGEGNLQRGTLALLGRDAIVLGNSLGWDGPVYLNAGASHNVIGGRSEEAPNRITGVDAVTLADGARLNVIIGNRLQVRRHEVRYSGPWANYVLGNS